MIFFEGAFALLDVVLYFKRMPWLSSRRTKPAH